jgi:hypothetical protein
VVAPQCPRGKYWTSAEIHETVNNILDSLINEFSVDENRLYITGVSLGGIGTWNQIILYPDRFAAAIPLCGEGDWTKANTIKHIAVWIFHGQEDNMIIVRNSRDWVNAFEEIGRWVVYTHCHYRDDTGLSGSMINMQIKAHSDLIYTEYKEKGHSIANESYDYPYLFPWVFSKYKLQSDAITITGLSGYKILSAIDTIEWNAINPEDSVEIWFSPDVGAHWQLMIDSTLNTGSYSWNTDNIPDCSMGLIKIFSKNSEGFIYGYDQSHIFKINNQMNGTPYVKIVNDEFIKNAEISEDIELKILINDAEEDSLDVSLYYSKDNGNSYLCFSSFKTVPDTNVQIHLVPLSTFDDAEMARIKVMVDDGNSTAADSTFYFRKRTSAIADRNNAIPREFTLSQNYPNPFNPVTRISYSIPRSGLVRLKIYNILGQEVRSLVNQFQKAGNYNITFDAKNLASGIYFYQLQVGVDYIQSKKMILMR